MLNTQIYVSKSNLILAKSSMIYGRYKDIFASLWEYYGTNHCDFHRNSWNVSQNQAFVEQ